MSWNANTTKRKKAKMVAALKSSLGVVSIACTTAGVGRTTHYKWLKIDPEYAEVVNELEDVALDFAETALLKQIKSGNVSSTIFYLKTKGKKRGYIEATHQTVHVKHVDEMDDMTEEELEKIIADGYQGEQRQG